MPLFGFFISTNRTANSTKYKPGMNYFTVSRLNHERKHEKDTQRAARIESIKQEFKAEWEKARDQRERAKAEDAIAQSGISEAEWRDKYNT
jgi:hypothetical protein